MKKLLALGTLLVGCIFSVSSIQASQIQLADSIQPRITCRNGCDGQLILVCRDDASYLGQTEHGSCKVDWYRSRYKGYVCPTCFAVETTSVGLDPTAKHDCYQKHSSCGKGKVVSCKGGGYM